MPALFLSVFFLSLLAGLLSLEYFFSMPEGYHPEAIWRRIDGYERSGDLLAGAG